MNGTEVTGQRGSFHSSYAISADRRDKQQKSLRLLECLISSAHSSDLRYFDPCAEGEFAVVDTATKEKAWFEMPRGASADDVTRMVESTFAAPSLRVDRLMWVV